MTEALKTRSSFRFNDEDGEMKHSYYLRQKKNKSQKPQFEISGRDIFE